VQASAVFLGAIVSANFDNEGAGGNISPSLGMSQMHRCGRRSEALAVFLFLSRCCGRNYDLC